jgi:hypothetical protein
MHLHERTSRPLQEGSLVLTTLQSNRLTEGDRTDDGDGQRFSFRQDPMHVLEEHGHELDVRAQAAQVIEAAFERRHGVAVAACAFGEDDQ